MRAQVLREEPVCHYCRAAPSVQVDHIIPLAEGGSSDRPNLAGSCFDCHEEKTQRESMRARAAQ
jgi:5-methylcytosine-specific restriction protein A